MQVVWCQLWSQKDENFEIEYAAIEEYKEKYDVVRVKYEFFLNNVIAYNIPVLGCPSLTSRGEIKEWLGFWSQFSRIHDDVDMPDEDKFQFIIQATVKCSRTGKY